MRKKDESKKDLIVNSAIAEFAREGFYDAGIARIAENAGIANGTVYVYFRNKEDILNEIFARIWGSLYAGMNALIKRKDIRMEEKYDIMIDMIFETLTSNPDTAIVVANEQPRFLLKEKKNFTEYYEKFIKLGERLIREGIKEKVFNPEIDIYVFRHFLLGIFRDILTSWVASPKHFPLKRVRKNIKLISKYGLLNHMKNI